MLIDDSLAFPGRRGRFLLSPEERRRLVVRDAVSWVLVGLIHLVFFMVLVVSLQENRDRLGRRGAIETFLDLTLPHRANAPLFDLIRPLDEKSPDQDTSAKPLTIIPPPITIINPNAPAAPGDVLKSIGEALACGANNFEYLTRAQQARCRRQPWQGVIMPNGTIVLDAPQRAPIPQLHMTGAEALRQQYQTNSGCPIMSNMPCLQDMFSGNNSRAPGIPDPH